jgi:hypothetical protein
MFFCLKLITAICQSLTQRMLSLLEFGEYCLWFVAISVGKVRNDKSCIF